MVSDVQLDVRSKVYAEVLTLQWVGLQQHLLRAGILIHKGFHGTDTADSIYAFNVQNLRRVHWLHFISS